VAEASIIEPEWAAATAALVFQPEALDGHNTVSFIVPFPLPAANPDSARRLSLVE
jgi:hypothetical protein